MAGGPKEKLQAQTGSEEHAEDREVFLRDGRKLVVSDQGSDQLVEIRSASGMLELRIKLTEEGPVLQMETVRMQLKASEGVEIESKRVEIKATETITVAARNVEIAAEEDVDVDAKNDVKVTGAMIYLN
jgi:phage gp45-like